MKTISRGVRVEEFQPVASRSKGIHCSDLIKRILRRMDPERFKGEEPDPNRLVVGFIWEEMISTGFASLARKKTKVHQFELCTEMCGRQVFFTLDGLDYAKWRVHEYKATWMSARHPITDHRFWHWFVQMKAYCKVAQTQEAELWAFFVNGTYRNGPEMKRWEVTFSKREIEENWLMLTNTLKEMIREGEV